MCGITRLYLRNKKEAQAEEPLLILDLQPHEARSKYRELRRQGWRCFHFEAL